MCLKAKKTLFASAFAMQALVYLTATNLETVKFTFVYYFTMRRTSTSLMAREKVES